MAVQDLTLPVHYLRYLSEFVAPLGVDVPQLLARSGLGALQLADPAAFAEAAQICQRELDKLEGGPALATKVRRVLLDQRNGFPSLLVTARLFHMTPRTLHRRLQEEGTSFAALLEDVRHMLALEHLKSDRLGIEEIGYLLGYTDLANFRRAFKRWEGVPPSLWRMSHVRYAG